MANLITRSVLWQAFKDFSNFIKFKRQIKREKANLASKFNLFNLKTNWLGNCIYTQKTLSDTQMMSDDKQKWIYLLDMTKAENQYLSNDLFWSEYLTYDVYNFAENGDPSNTYGIVWKYTPYALFSKRFWFWLAVLAIAIYGVCKAFTTYNLLAYV